MGLSGAMHTLLTLLRDPWRSNHSKLGMLGLEMMFHARRVLHVTDILVSLNERGPASQVRLPARRLEEMHAQLLSVTVIQLRLCSPRND